MCFSYSISNNICFLGEIYDGVMDRSRILRSYKWSPILISHQIFTPGCKTFKYQFMVSVWCSDVEHADTNTPTVEFVKDTEITFHFHSPSKIVNSTVSLAPYLVTNIAWYSSPCLQTPFLNWSDLDMIWYNINSISIVSMFWFYPQ